MLASINASRQITQLVVALCLLAGLSAVVLVALSTPARTVIAHDIQTVLTMSLAFVAKLSALAPSATAVTRYPLCGSSIGPC